MFHSDNKFTYTWEHGRELVCVTAPSGAQVLATYGADGLRTGRVVKYSSGAVKAAYTYVYDGGKLSRMTYGNYVVDITYDAAGTPLTMIVNGQTTYYYVTNLQGDVIALKDATGTEVITYSYDAWGNVVSRTGTYATLNPLLYRGYVYDWETHHYYLQSRYYNPEWGRFINGDAYTTTGQGFIEFNMFAYCLNNPISFIDPFGTCVHNKRLFVNCEKCQELTFWEKVSDWLKNEKKEAEKNDNVTTTNGFTLGAAFGGAASASGGLTKDTKGNIGFSLTFSGGGVPSAGVGIFSSTNNAPTIYDQEGLGVTFGASGGPVVIAGGVEYNMLIDQKNDCYYHGSTVYLTYGVCPTVVELHGEMGYTKVWGFNLYDVAIEIADYLAGR